MMPLIDLNLLHHTPAKYAPVKRGAKTPQRIKERPALTWLDRMLKILRRPLIGTAASS